MNKCRLAIIGSTRGTTLLSLLDEIKQRRRSLSIELVISNRADALILERAAQAGLATVLLNEPSSFETQASTILQAHSIDIIILIGYMRILSPNFVAQWRNKIINIHPSLLPDFAGLRDERVHQAVLAQGQSISGCSVHYVTEEVDQGPIIVQRTCPVFPDDSVASLKARVQALEGLALIQAIDLVK